MSRFAPLVRSASLNGYPSLAKACGLNPETMLRRVGLPPRSWSDPDMLLRADGVHALLEHSAAVSGVDDFGLRLAATRQFSNLGPVSLVLQGEPTVRHALEALCRYVQLLNPSLRVWLESRGELLLVREEFVTASDAVHRQSAELALGILHRILVALLGASWQPVCVVFRHPAPPDPTPHRLFFGTRLEFGGGFNGIVCQTADLDVEQLGANPQMAQLARRYLERALSDEAQGSRAIVRQLMVLLLPGGRCTSSQVAHHLGIDRRTLHRHLDRERTTFSEVLQSVRVDLATRLVGQTVQPLAAVSSMLGFASPSGFAYWFTATFGCNARAWRQRERERADRVQDGGLEPTSN